MGSAVQEHEFAKYVRILGKGKKGSRSLTQDEARDAMAMILNEQVRPEQLGAFLMLLRVKEESPDELAGFVEAVRAFNPAPSSLSVDLDWSSYAGKKRHLPWFLLAAFVLAENGHRVFMHGAKGHTAGRLYTEEMLEGFAITPCYQWSDVEHELAESNFAFMPISALVPKMAEIIDLRSFFGLRSPVHTLCRMLNPLLAKHCVDGVFHPAYAPMHQKTSALLGVENGLTIRGDGGEAELRPDAECEVRWVNKGELTDQMWPRLYEKRQVKDSVLQVEQLRQLWRGEIEHIYGEGAVRTTLAACLQLLNLADDVQGAQSIADKMWQQRNKKRY